MRLTTFLLSILTAAAIIISSQHAEARKIKSSHPIKRINARQQRGEESAKDSIILITDSMPISNEIAEKIQFYGFDKTISSSSESFFIVNGLDMPLSGMEIEISYFDMKGRQLNSQNVKIDCDIPAGETRRLDIKSWDIQKSFYYFQSAKPKRQATPFDVKIKLLSVKIPQ